MLQFAPFSTLGVSSQGLAMCAVCTYKYEKLQIPQSQDLLAARMRIIQVILSETN